jgi:molecular chaperone DnaJ
VLGVPSDASFSTIRTAYRERARHLHPDRTGDRSDGASAMASVNEAYRVLAEPRRRALYDRTLSEPTSAPQPTTAETVTADDRPADLVTRHPASLLSPSGPARVPWKLMAVAAVLGSALVLITAAFNDPPSEEPPDGIIRAGSCVVIEANGDAREVACTNTPADIVVSLLLPTGATCPVELAPHRDRLGLGTACIPYER